MFGDRVNRSWLVAKESYAVLKSNPGLTLFPVLSAIATVLVSIPFLILLVPIAIASKGHHHASSRSTTW